MALDRETVLDAALHLIDEVGLDGLSLRRLAKELGVQAPALYWHFSSKQDLLDHLVAAANARADHGAPAPGPDQTWDEWLAEGMRLRRRAMLAHRDGARLASGNRPTPESWPRIERTVRVLVDAGFDPADAVRAIIVLSQYLTGFVLDEQADPDRADDAPPKLDSVEFPLLTAAGPVALDRDTLFDYGLRCLLDGMRARISAPPR